MLLVAVLLVPALLCGAAGNRLRFSFFAGAALYVGVMKWLGRLVFGRYVQTQCRYLLFPAEFFAGLAVACGWFYVRNALGWLWPGSYSLMELRVLAWAIAAFQVLIWLTLLSNRLKAWRQDRPAARHALLQRLWLYVPFALLLTCALWQLSNVLHVQQSDAYFHAFSTRVFHDEGLWFAGFTNGKALGYPSGFGAINAVTLAVAPLTPVQVVNLQHVLLLLLGISLISSVLGVVAGTGSRVLQGAALVFIPVFPIYCLAPELFGSSTGRQAAPALLAALCLLPLLANVRSTASFLCTVGVQGLLATLLVALNPTTAPFVAFGGLAGIVVIWRRQRVEGITFGWRRIMAALALAALPACLLVACDRYYSALVVTRDNSVRVTLGPASNSPFFSLADAAAALPRINPLVLSPLVSLGTTPAELDYLNGWNTKAPQSAMTWTALALAVLALGAYFADRKRGAAPEGRIATPIRFAGGCLLLWLALKYTLLPLAAGLAKDRWEPCVLGVYVGFLLIRCELLLLFGMLLSGGMALVEMTRGRLGTPTLRLLTAIAATIVLGSAALCVMEPSKKGGLVVAPTQSVLGVIEDDDIQLAGWMDENLPPEKGLVGLAARTFASSLFPEEKHLYAAAGEQAVVLYGRHYNYRFAMPSTEPANFFDDYQANVQTRFNAAWCLEQGIRYFYVSELGRQLNPGIAAAIKHGTLRPVQIRGKSGVYEIVPPLHQERNRV